MCYFEIINRAYLERWSVLKFSKSIDNLLLTGRDQTQFIKTLFKFIFIGNSTHPQIYSLLKYGLAHNLLSKQSFYQAILSLDKSKLHSNALKNFLSLFSQYLDSFVCIKNNINVVEHYTLYSECILWILEQFANQLNQKIENNVYQKFMEILEKIFYTKELYIILIISANMSSALFRFKTTFIAINQLITTNNFIDTADRNVLSSLLNIKRLKIENIVSNSNKNLCNVFITPNNFVFLEKFITIQALQFPLQPISFIVNQILFYQHFNNIGMAQTFSHIIKQCFENMIEVFGQSELELKWATFTFLKLPQIFAQTLRTNIYFDSKSYNESRKEYLISALKSIVYGTQRIESINFKYQIDVIQIFINQLTKYQILTESEGHTLLEIKAECKVEVNMQSKPHLVIRGEPTVTSILKTLDLDCNKNMESLLSVLCHVISKKSLDLILTVATATGQLAELVFKLIKFVEFSKEGLAEGSKSSNSRALLYDISFLILTYTVQRYGTQVLELEFHKVHSQATSWEEVESVLKNSFFIHWVADNVVLGRGRGGYDPFKYRDNNKVEAYLSMLLAPNFDMKTTLVKWHDFCRQIPYVFYELFLAQQHEALSKEAILKILDIMKKKVFASAVCVFTWTYTYLPVLDHELYACVKDDLIAHLQQTTANDKGGNDSPPTPSPGGHIVYGNGGGGISADAPPPSAASHTSVLASSATERSILTHDIIMGILGSETTVDTVKGQIIQISGRDVVCGNVVTWLDDKGSRDLLGPIERIVAMTTEQPPPSTSLIMAAITDFISGMEKGMYQQIRYNQTNATNYSSSSMIPPTTYYAEPPMLPYPDLADNLFPTLDALTCLIQMDVPLLTIYLLHAISQWVLKSDGIKIFLTEPLSDKIVCLVIECVCLGWLYEECHHLNASAIIEDLPNEIKHNENYINFIVDAQNNVSSKIVTKFLLHILGNICETFTKIMGKESIEASSQMVLKFLLKVKELPDKIKKTFLTILPKNLIHCVIKWYPQYFSEETILTLFDTKSTVGLTNYGELLSFYYQVKYEALL